MTAIDGSDAVYPASLPSGIVDYEFGWRSDYTLFAHFSVEYCSAINRATTEEMREPDQNRHP